MSSSYALKINPEQAKEMPMVDLAFEVLKAANTPFYYRDLMMEISKIKGLSEEEVMQVIAQIYTEINIDGRFACIGSNLWGLKRWYPVEKGDDNVTGGAKRPRIINDEDDDLDDDDMFAEEEDAYSGDDSFDEEGEELYGEDEDVEEAEDDVAIEDAEIEDEDADAEIDEELDDAEEDEEEADLDEEEDK
ncbi:DNA-directed RNA polymerase subunit delta [Paenibacillus swuensis]|uniref:Probable DNA-directed RNA polymerase subunit delta n=1 Tax=Paenibacillus swuensis TaxID=1178515 RepID=A0A172TFR7_9BACL|nr:DNA-directed RNA polymerase subunit delta [Paenibacillus swuensis]ANE45899.1 DNA-directed RNA polymerase subunit delta [Paenibacillus swuensis]